MFVDPSWKKPGIMTPETEQEFHLEQQLSSYQNLDY